VTDDMIDVGHVVPGDRLLDRGEAAEDDALAG